MQSPWVFFTSALPNHHAPTKPGAGLIPLNCPQAAAPSLLSAPAAPFGAFSAPAHHHHPSQILLAAAAAAYGQQCAAASLLQQHPHPHQHSHQHQHQLPNGNFHLKVDESAIAGPPTKRKSASEDPENVVSREIKKAKLETKALKAKRPGFTDERYNETSYYVENGLRKVYPYYFTFTTFTKGRWVGEKILDVFAREFRAHPVEEYERCIKSGTLTVNYTKVDTDYRLKHNDLLANIVHRHEVPVTSDPIEVVHMDEDLVVVNKPASIPVHPCGRYRHNTVVFILAKEHQLKNLRTIHRLDRLTSGLLLFGRSPKKAREMEQQIRNRLVSKEYVCRVEGEFPDEVIECSEPIEVVSYKIGVCKVSKEGKDCRTTFKKLSSNGKTSVVVAKPHTGRMHQIRVHLQYLGYPIVNDPLYNHAVFGPEKGKGGLTGKTDEELIKELISIHNAENWLGIEGEEAGGPTGDIFGPPCPPTVDNHGCSSSSPGIGDVDANASDVKSDSSTTPIENGAAIDETTTETTAISTIPVVTENERSSPNGNVGKETVEIGIGTNVEEPVAQMTPGKVTVGTQTCEEESLSSLSCRSTSGSPQSTSSSSVQSQSTPVVPTNSSSSVLDNNNADPLAFSSASMTYDPHCYECKVRYRDPKPKDLVMYLHALKYYGPDWGFETKMPAWASEDWVEADESC